MIPRRRSCWLWSSKEVVSRAWWAGGSCRDRIAVCSGRGSVVLALDEGHRGWGVSSSCRDEGVQLMREVVVCACRGARSGVSEAAEVGAGLGAGGGGCGASALGGDLQRPWLAVVSFASVRRELLGTDANGRPRRQGCSSGMMRVWSSQVVEELARGLAMVRTSSQRRITQH